MDWQLLSYVFGLIFIAELPDKTALACVVLGSRFKPWPVFIGAAAAFLAQGVIAVTFGYLLSELPQKILHLGIGALFVLFGILMWFKKDSEEPKNIPDVSSLKVISISFVTIFIAELGDFTQLSTMALAAKFNTPIPILIASTLALWLVAAMAIFSGREAKKYINNPAMKKLASIVFFTAGVIYIFTGF